MKPTRCPTKHPIKNNYATYFCNLFLLWENPKTKAVHFKKEKIEPWVSYVLRQVKHCCVAKKKIGKSMLVELCVTDKTYLAALHSEARLGDFADV
jgi:hypothetical protein